MGWATKSCFTSEALPLEALNHAIATAKGSLKDLVHHSDHGSPYVCIAYHERLSDVGIDESTGSVGDSYGNALAESVNGPYKDELIHAHTRESLAEVEWALLCWVHWRNTQWLHSELDYHTPQETDNHY